MITITISNDGVRYNGHACEPLDVYKDEGHRVCAACSALTQTLGDGVRTFAPGPVSTRYDSGDGEVIWGSMTERVAVIVETYAMGIKGVASASNGRVVVKDCRGKC